MREIVSPNRVCSAHRLRGGPAYYQARFLKGFSDGRQGEAA